jgi:hypothetical protein
MWALPAPETIYEQRAPAPGVRDSAREDSAREDSAAGPRTWSYAGEPPGVA